MPRCVHRLIQVLMVSATTIANLDAQDPKPLPRPNILWITCEDAGSRFGCYGDKYARTPNIDALAASGVIYRRAFSHAPVPTTSRAGAITGEYPTSTGAHHVPSRTLAPKHLKCVSEILRAAGYHCTNRHFEHYGLGPMRFAKNLPRESWSPFAAWDFTGSQKATWRSRADSTQAFFAIMGHRGTDKAAVHDPGEVSIPPYLADTADTRKAIAAQYDRIHSFDVHVGEVLAQLEKDGLADDTIVWISSTNGRDLPREKRWLYDAGTAIALIVRVPEKYRPEVFGDLAKQRRPGSSCDELVGTIDFAATALSITRQQAPAWLRGRAFLGRDRSAAPQYLFAARDRIGEAYDCLRSVRDGRFLYIRNHMPSLSYSQPCGGQDASPAMQELRRLHADGKLTGVPARFFQPKTVEELYDTQNDPHQIHDLVSDPKHSRRLLAMREAQIQWSLRTKDIGLIPEVQFNRFKIQKFGVIRCPKPLFRLAKDDRGRTAVQIACSTADSSVIYQVDGRGAAGAEHWNLYTEPVTLTARQVITAHGVGIGNNRSPVASFKIGDPQATEAQVEADHRAPHWTIHLSRTKILEQLQNLKRRDFTGEAALASYHNSYQETATDLRYWSLLAIHRLARSPAELQAANKVYVSAIKSSSDAVRMASARILASSDEHRSKALDEIRHMLYSPNFHAAFEGSRALAQIGAHGAPLKADVENLLGRISKVLDLAGYLPPPLAPCRRLSQRFLDSAK
ncbi:MAG: sulfatase [Planctomycetota bacterium]|nr:sulfatase [Planctomycetota bacterium]